MILERGDMFSMWGKTDLFLFTSNPIINKQGLAVMGRGIAKQLADRLPTIRYDFTRRLRLLQPVLKSYCDIIGVYDDQPVGFFMVKAHWREHAKLGIIERATRELNAWLMDDPEINRVDLNFPGIGNGKLSREDVLPIISKLPDNVHVWEYDES